MSEQLGTQYDRPKEYVPARLEHELKVRDYMRGMVLLGQSESEKRYDNLADAQASVMNFSKTMIAVLGEAPALSSVIMQVTGENVRLNDTTVEKNEETGDVTIKTEPSLLGEYVTRPFQYTNLYGSIEQIDETEQYKTNIYIIGIDLNAVQQAVSGHENSLGARIGVEPTLAVPCEDGIELDSLLVQQTEARMTALEELMTYSNDTPELVSQLTIVEQEIQGIKPNHNYRALKSIDKVRHMGEIGKAFSARSFKHADILNTAITEVFTRNRPLQIEGEGYMHDDQNNIVKTDLRGFTGTLVDVVANVPTVDQPTGQAFAMSVRMPEGEKLCYLPLAQIKALYL